VRDAWREVGIQVAGGGSIRPSTPTATMKSRSADQDSLAALHARVDKLSKTVEQLVNLMQPVS
jgi:hypothetical protein